MRIVAWTLRFINKCKRSEIVCGELSYNELSTARKQLFQQVQRCQYQREVEALAAGKAIATTPEYGNSVHSSTKTVS